MSDKPTCFVIYPFCELYHKRFNEIYKPAIEDAGCVAQRAGEAGSDIITKEIRDNIRKSDICFADISLDNPNVWYEVGFAHACKKQITMVCNTDIRELNKLPFDVRIRKVIGYKNLVNTDKHNCKGFELEISENMVEKLKKSTDDFSSTKQFIVKELTVAEKNVLRAILNYKKENKEWIKDKNLILRYGNKELYIVFCAISKLKEREFIIQHNYISQDGCLMHQYELSEKAIQLVENRFKS